MLPNWLYGKSKSKLAELLGGGGTPSDYNEVKAQVTQNAEDILLLSDALDDKAALTQITNPNILHNPWFQVNQRGETTATASGLFVDRWKVVCAATGSSTFTLNADGTITIDNSLGEAPCFFVQRRTAKTISRVAGRTITASIMLSDGTIHSGTGTYVDTETTNYYEDNDIKIQSIAQLVGQFFALRVEAGKTITIKALKLELGSVSTLAMDTAPDMALELAKCQRYFQNIVNTDASNNRMIGIAYAVSTTSARILVTLPDHMRTNAPQFSKSGDFVLQPIAGGTAIDVPSVASLGLMETYINIKADVTSGLTAGSAYFFQAKPNAKLNFDAEL